jgi:4,5-DOPA dioxygenase extradiol
MQKLQPVLFLSHGSPMNAVEDNAFTRALSAFASRLERPKAVLCVSAHWQSAGPLLGSAASAPLVYDFYGFPPELYKVAWPAPGSPELARRTAGLLSAWNAGLEPRRGLDHGAWTVLMKLFPEADIPAIQLSLAEGLGPEAHLELARALAPLRAEGVLVVGSGNFTHNLGEVSWDEAAKPPAWARDFDDACRKAVEACDLGFLAKSVGDSRAGRLLAHPSDEHLLPLLYAAALASSGERATTVFEGWQNGSLSMRSIAWEA